MIVEASGPEQIRVAFAAAGERIDEVGGIATVLDDAADRYESLDMQASTVAHLRDAGRACGTAQAAVASAAEQLRAALADFTTMTAWWPPPAPTPAAPSQARRS